MVVFSYYSSRHWKWQKSSSSNCVRVNVKGDDWGDWYGVELLSSWTNKKLHFILRTVSTTTYHAQIIHRETSNSTGNQCPCSIGIHEHETTMKWALYLLPNMNRSKLLLKWYSYIKKLSGPSTLHPSNFTKFLWRTWLITSTSLKNWSIHCFVFRNSLFAATSFPPGRIACRSNNYYLWVQAIWSLAGCKILVQLYCKNVQLKWEKKMQCSTSMYVPCTQYHCCLGLSSSLNRTNMLLSLNPYNWNSDLIEKSSQEVQSHTNLQLLKYYKQLEQIRNGSSYD